MARAKRHFITGYVWHITHRCHKRDFLLKLVKDRQRWIDWLFQTKKRYGLSVLNYIITSNHIHLLVFDNGGKSVIPDSIRLVAGRVGQEYNIRKNRKGAYWEDRYHATAIQTNEHLIKCIVYIDLNMVRAGVVSHPSEWKHFGYNEIQNPKKRYSIIDFAILMRFLQLDNYEGLKESHHKWVEEELTNRNLVRDNKWTESIGVGDKFFLKTIKKKLGYLVRGRSIIETGNPDAFQLREAQATYRTPLIKDISNKIIWDI
jgi:putative transposase